MSRTHLITGGAGFIGSHVARQLAERCDRVVLLDQRPPAGDVAWWLKPVQSSITFVPGQTEATVAIVIKGDTKSREGHERFFVNLSNAWNALIGDGQGIGTILNDD